ncbi:MAG: protoporphyrinogen oxidase [Blastocatellia bacterium]
MKFDSIIIGAGLTGLVAGYRLKKLGRAVLLLDSGARGGGVICSNDVEGFLIEAGPNSFRGTHELLDLVDELGLTDELVAANPRAPAYVYSGGELHAVPMNPAALIKTKLLTTSAKLRLLREPFVKARSGDSEESIASFVQRRLGDEILDKLAAPFCCWTVALGQAVLSVRTTWKAF